MADGKDPKDYYLQTGEIVDTSNRKAVKFLTTKLSGETVTIKVDWDTQAYPNTLLKRVPNDERGQLKPKVESAPPKVGSFGELYVAKALCEKYGLEQSKFPSELPLEAVYHHTKREVRSLVMQCKDDNGELKTLNILLSSAVDLSRGLFLREGRIEFWMSEEGFIRIGETAPSLKAADVSGEPDTQPNASSPIADAAARELARLGLEYCSSVPDTQLRAVIVPLLKIIGGSN
jgi:hypothetical protein